MSSEVLKIASETLKIEAESILALINRLDQNFLKAVDLILSCKGKVIFTGIGKSGQIARKLASTFSSTGTPSLYLHPAESSHGDLGVISDQDLIIAISYGGEAVELNSLLKFSSRRSIQIIALTGKVKSSLAQAAAIVLDVSVEKEACPLNLAPTSSSTATLAFGDALAMAVLHKRGFKTENFAELHPAGSLGAKLLRVQDVMQSGSALPFVNQETSMKDVISSMTHQSVRGAAVVLNDMGELIGVITDGDVRRLLEKELNILNLKASDVMSKSPRTIEASELAEKALFLMEQFRIQMLIVLDQNSNSPLKPVGMLIYQDLLTAKVR